VCEKMYEVCGQLKVVRLTNPFPYTPG